MSNSGDDNIDDLIRELRRTNQRLDQLVQAIMRGTEGEGEGEDRTVVDLWNVGRSSPNVSTTSEYIQERGRAANSPNVGAPSLINVSNFAEFFLEVYRRGGEHLQRISNGLSSKDFNKFVRELSTDYEIIDELIELANPSSDMFGIDVIERDVVVDYDKTPMSFIKISGNHYYYPLKGMPESGIRPTNPIDTLGLIRMEQDLENFRVIQVGAPGQPPINDEDNFIIFGGTAPNEVNQKLARIVSRKTNVKLPDDYHYLL